MIRSLFTILKNQFGQNILPGIFICFVSVLLFYVVDFSVTYTRLYSIPNGADANNTYAFHIDRLQGNTQTGDTLVESFDRLVQQIAQLPGVTDYSVSGYAYPYTNWMWNGDISSGDHTATGVFYRFVDHRYFSLFSLQLQEGRWFTPEEIANKEHTVLISDNAARELSPDGSSVIGRYARVSLNRNETDSFRIVGVVAGIKDNDFDQPLKAMYIPIGHFNSGGPDLRIPQLVIRVPKANEAQFAPALDNFIVHYLADTGFNIMHFYPVAKVQEDNNARISKDLALYAMGASFFLINILLAIFGTFTFRMKRRISEMGVRIALGSTKRSLFTFVIGEALLLTIFLSVYIPARKAATIAPAEALHYE